MYDVESAVLTGRIVERQVDRTRGDRKYVIRGWPAEGDDTVVVIASSVRRARSCFWPYPLSDQ